MSPPTSSPAASVSSSVAHPERAAAAAPPSVSVLLPVYNGEHSIRRAVASVASQLPPPGEILLIDDGSTDGSSALLVEIAKSTPGARLVPHGENAGLASTLNEGVRTAEGELVLVLHQDCSLVGSDWLARAARHFDNPVVISAVGSPIHNVERMDPLEREFWVLRHHAMDTTAAEQGRGRYTLFSENKCDMFRRSALLQLGGFDTRLEEGGEDQVLAWRLRQTQYRVVRDPELRFTIMLGASGGLRTHLRKDASYGRQMRQVLATTRFGALRRAPGASVDPRFVNRMSGVLWIFLALVGVGLYLWTRAPFALLVIGVPPVARWAQLTLRGIRERKSYRLRGRELATMGGIGWMADVAYAVGFAVPRGRRRSRESLRPPS
ncbi:MAG: glycosyltransferase family 2 protein [Thermoplasmata archaeon]|nr:glycosyltransferase family 2 protein [Thermoplasmata archaeon]